MARVKQLDVITGSIKNLSFYTVKGSDEVFVRTKGGASKNSIKRRPELVNIRKSNMEFGGCSKMSKEIRQTFASIAHVADYNLTPILSSLAKSIQKGDTVHPVGERSLQLSKYRTYLNGFDFNKSYRFDSILRIPLQWNMDRQVQQATVDLPDFACSMGLYLPGNYSLFRILITMASARDMTLNEHKNGYEHTIEKLYLGNCQAATPWYSTQASVPAQQLLLNCSNPYQPLTDDDTLILAIAIEFGNLDAFGNPTALKHAGAGKILGAV
jgi:hypothetical protein